MRTFEETIKSFPHHAKIKPVKVADNGRSQMREWLTEHHIRIYHLYGDTADVVWDTAWSNFYFKHNTHAVLFKLKWL